MTNCDLEELKHIALQKLEQATNFYYTRERLYALSSYYKITLDGVPSPYRYFPNAKGWNNEYRSVIDFGDEILQQTPCDLKTPLMESLEKRIAEDENKKRCEKFKAKLFNKSQTEIITEQYLSMFDTPKKWWEFWK